MVDGAEMALEAVTLNLVLRLELYPQTPVLKF